MRTWAGAAGVPETVCKMLGRWTPSVDKSYDRSIAAQVVRAQIHVAEFIRKNIGRVDPFGENAVVQLVEDRMLALGYHLNVVGVQREKLECFVAVGRPLKRVSWSEGSATAGPMESHGNEGSESSADEDGDWVVIDAAAKRNTGLVLGDYVVSIIGRAKTKTLHRYGECYRQPGVHYREFESFGSELPKAKMYHRACRVCFAKAVKSTDESGSDGSGSDEDVSSSSSESL